ncbi:MAG TPA: GTPase HflX, partial [Psychrobacter sp.]|nr:GTPase HflX [Psychrobacter sp.]
NIYAADQLFATLDPTLRRLDWQGVGRVVLVDTVGFVRHLPHELVESFHATLEETLEADLLLHVIDSSSPDMHEQIKAVKSVLAEINSDVPVLNVYNKIDLTDEPARIKYSEPGVPSRVYVSAKSDLGMSMLTTAVQQLLTGKLNTFELTLPFHAGNLKNELYRLDVVEQESYDESGHEILTLRLPADKLQQLLGQSDIDPFEVLPKEQAELLIPKLEPFEKELKQEAEQALLSDANLEEELADYELDENPESLSEQEPND